MEEVKEFSRQIIDEIDNGEINALDLKIFLKGLEKMMEIIKPKVDQAALEYAQTFGEKQFQYRGAKVELAEAGVKYNYELCGYPKWHQYTATEKEAAEYRKEIERQLQSLKGKTIMGDPDTGESWEVYPPQKKSTSIVKISI